MNQFQQSKSKLILKFHAFLTSTLPRYKLDDWGFESR